MTVSVTDFKARCLELIRQLENDGQPVEIVRRGKLVARLYPAGGARPDAGPPWLALRGTGRLDGDPGESVMEDDDFEALR